MSKIIPGVPESITRKQYLGLIEGVGFDVETLVSLEFRVDGIYAEVKEKKDGRDIVDEGRLEVVKNHVYIPVEG